ncbi:MAG: ZIP family metal transporter [Bacteroidia bacterium]|jgi:zinc and cadmium transporter
MSWLSLSLLLLSPLLGGLLVLLVTDRYSRQLKLLLTFCGGFLFATAVLHLLPEVFETNHHYEGLLILVGFFLQMLLEKFSEGIEHGHLHLDGHHGHDHGQHDHSHYHRHGLSYGLLISLSIHSLVEGIPLNGTFSIDQAFWQNPLLLGVIIHKFPSAFALMTVLRQSVLQKSKQLWMLGLFIVMTPLGVFLGHIILQSNTAHMDEVFHVMLALATGSFLQIATTILFESTANHQFSAKHILLAFAGAVLAFLI